MDTLELELLSEESRNFFYAMSNKTRREILILVSQYPNMNISRIANLLNQTSANTSYNIQILQKAKIINGNYSSVRHGIEKKVSLKYNRIIIKIPQPK